MQTTTHVKNMRAPVPVHHVLDAVTREVHYVVRDGTSTGALVSFPWGSDVGFTLNPKPSTPAVASSCAMLLGPNRTPTEVSGGSHTMLASVATTTQGLTLVPFQLNLSAVCVIGSGFKGHAGGV
jgi:hypothetical protein